MENTGARKETAEDLFFKFMDAEDCPEITHTFHRLVKILGIKADSPREFYSLLKGRLQSWRCKSLWEQLDSRANQKEYGKGKICEDNQVLIIGAGPIGLRTAIEVALLGAQVVIVEKRESFVRNNVLHLWPFLLTDFRSLGAKKFYGKFCSGSIDHISIRRLQAILLKSALIFGAKLYTGVTFEHMIEPNSLEDGWKCKVSPENHPVSSYEFDVLIGADGKKNVIPGFQQIEMRGTLAIGITANFVNHCTEEEANVEEISGIAYQFNPQFFDDLYAHKGIKLENIVYYKDETHYFVMTAGKASLLKRGALKEDLGQSAKLLSPCNIDHSKLLEYVTDVVKYATKGTLKTLELKIVGNNQPDIAAFDFTSIKKAEHAARIIERNGSKLLVGLVGDSLLEPFWPTGSGCARGVLSALDAAWMIRSFAQDKPPLQILSERENIYRLLSGTSAENLHKDHAKYTINPSSRYLHITHKKIREVYHLYDTDDAVNADFSLGSPQTAVINKASRRRKISTGVKFTSSKGRKRGRASSHRAAESGASRIRSTSGSSMENLDMHKPLESRLQKQTTQSSAGSDDEVFERKPRRVQINPRAGPLTVKGRRSPMGSSGDELKGKKKKTTRKRTLSKENLDNTKGETRKKSRGFFGFGKSKAKYRVNEDSDHHSDKESKLCKVKHREEREKPESRPDILREDSWKRRPAGAFSREQYTRRSARDIIREMEARSKGDAISNGVENNDKVSQPVLESKLREKDGGMKRKNNLGNGELEGKHKIKKEDEKKKHKENEKKRKEEEKRRHEEEKQRKEHEEKARKKEEEEIKKREQANNLHNKKVQSTPENTKSKKQALLDQIAKISPSAKRAMPVLSKLSPELDKENEKGQEHSVTSVVREAAMLVMATPLLLDGLLPKKLDRTGSWLAKSSGRVRDVVQRYNTLNDMKPVIKPMNGDITPLKWPRDSVDGCDEKLCEIKSDEAEDGNESQYSVNQNDSCEVKPTPPSQKKRTLQMKKDEKLLISSPSLERLKIKLQDCQDGSPLSDKESSSTNEKHTVDFNSPIWQKTPIAAMEEIKEKNKKKEDSIDDKSSVEAVSTSAHEHVIKDSASGTIWQNTVIAEVTEKSDSNKENNQEALSNSITNTKATEEKLTTIEPSQTSRRASVSPSEPMEEKLANLVNKTSAQKAWESIKYMIGLFKQIQRHPNEEKYYRIFKGRVKFRKHIWTVKNAKLFMLASGWTEVGSFVVFPLSKPTEGPVLVLNKYLSIAEEKRLDEQSDERKENRPILQRSCSSDLAEKIMELKEALVSSRSNSYKTRRLSGEKNSKSIFLHRAVSMEEVNKLRSTVEECSSPLKDSKHGESEFQKLNTRLEGEETEEPASNLRRSMSENALYFSPHHNDDYPPTFSPIIKRFSQRGVKEQEASCDLVMENPLPLENSVGDKKQTQDSTQSSLADDEVAYLPERDELTAEQYPDRQVMRSPRDIVREEADQLSSVLGTILDNLGSSTDSEKESDWEPKELKKEPEKANDPGAVVDQYKDEELEALCATLDLIIQDNTSESSSESGDDKITNVKPSNLQPQTEAGHENAFKPPVHPTRRTTQHLGKTKSLDVVNQSKNSTIASGRSNRERVTKSKSVDAASLTGNRRSQEALAAGTRRKISRTAPKSATNRPESSIKIRTQRYSSTSEASNRKQIGSRNKRQSTNRVKPPTMKRPASKVQSVDMDRPRTRQSLVKSKSVDHQNTGFKTPGQSQAKARSTLSSSSEDDKKPQNTKTAERGRVQPARRSSGEEKSHASSTRDFKNRGSKSSSEENNSTVENERSKRSREPLAKVGDNAFNTEVLPQINEKSSSQAVPEQRETDNYSGDPVGSSKDKAVTANCQKRGSWEYEDVNQENQTLPINFGHEDEIELENHNEIVELSKEIQSCYAEIPLLPNGRVSEGAEGKREITEVKSQLSNENELRDFDQDNKQPLSLPEESKENGSLNQTDDKQCTQSQTSNRKMTLLDIGKQQSKARSARKETASLSLDVRKQRILEAADAKPQSKPANKRRSILQIKNRNDGKLVKNKKETFEKSNLAQEPSVNGSLNKSPRRRHFRFHGRRKKSFELSNEQLYVVPEDNEEEGEEKKNGVIPSKEAQGARHHDGVTREPKTEGEKIEKNVEKEKSRSPVKISPFQLRFTKQRGSYDLEKRVDSLESCKQNPSEYD